MPDGPGVLLRLCDGFLSVTAPRETTPHSERGHERNKKESNNQTNITPKRKKGEGKDDEWGQATGNGVCVRASVCVVY